VQSPDPHTPTVLRALGARIRALALAASLGASVLLAAFVPAPAAGAGTHPPRSARRSCSAARAGAPRARGSSHARCHATRRRRTRNGTRRRASVRVHAFKNNTSSRAGRDAQASEAAADAATIAAVLAAPCSDTEVTPEAANIPLVRAAVLCLINRERAQHGELPLRLNGELEAAAQSHTDELVADDYFAHVSPSGETPVERIRATGYVPNPFVGYIIGENLAWGTYTLSTPQSIVSAWIASPPHLANILEGQYRDTGIGITAAVPPSLAEGAPGATYGQEFGVIVR